MAENNTNSATEESIAQNILELGGIPIIEMEVSASGMTAYPVDRTLSLDGMPADAKTVGDRLNDDEAAITDVAEDVTDILTWTGEDIPISAEDQTSISEVISGMTSDPYPVGSIYMTTSSDAPAFDGTWEEIKITATWNQLKTGKRGYEALESGDTGGTVHFWHRTA